ncbi:hypothetical protein LguiA_026287 [Lonicera macranthoides]
MTRSGCPYRCNNTAIPYPFGIGPTCYRDASFEIDCNNSSGTLTPYVKGTVLEVLEITVSNGQIRVSNPEVTSLGVNLTGRPFRNYNVTAVSAVLEWSTYGNCSNGNFTCGVNARCTQVTASDIGCSCPDGFQGNPYVQCEDIDECTSTFTKRCSMGCENFPGGYRCLCGRGYELVDNSTCLYTNIIKPRETKSNSVSKVHEQISSTSFRRGAWTVVITKIVLQLENHALQALLSEHFKKSISRDDEEDTVAS